MLDILCFQNDFLDQLRFQIAFARKLYCLSEIITKSSILVKEKYIGKYPVYYITYT